MDNPGFVKEGVELQQKMDARRANTELRNPASQNYNTGPDDLPADLQVEIAKRYEFSCCYNMLTVHKCFPRTQ